MTYEEAYVALFGPPALGMALEEIPCREQSDVERLCKHPLVSICMTTYNHEKWIAQAIESVVAQEADFEYELVIGEDCSSDHTREICFDYQRRYPDKIRVLWADVNVFKIGMGNFGRVFARCRGEFFNLTEGDDYWVDPHRLQKQVDLIREKGVDACTAFHQVLYPDGRLEDVTYSIPASGLLGYRDVEQHYFHMTTYVVRKRAYEDMFASHPDIVDGWFDTVLFPCLAARGPVALLPEIISVYRRTGSGLITGADMQNTCLLGIRQGLIRLAWCPELPPVDAASVIMPRLAYLFNRGASGYSKDFLVRHGRTLVRLFWQLWLRTAPSVMGFKALGRMIQFRWFS